MRWLGEGWGEGDEKQRGRLCSVDLARVNARGEDKVNHCLGMVFQEEMLGRVQYISLYLVFIVAAYILK